jgi:hypothetical protein
MGIMKRLGKGGKKNKNHNNLKNRLLLKDVKCKKEKETSLH